MSESEVYRMLQSVLSSFDGTIYSKDLSNKVYDKVGEKVLAEDFLNGTVNHTSNSIYVEDSTTFKFLSLFPLIDRELRNDSRIYHVFYRHEDFVSDLTHVIFEDANKKDIKSFGFLVHEVEVNHLAFYYPDRDKFVFRGDERGDEDVDC